MVEDKPRIYEGARLPTYRILWARSAHRRVWQTFKREGYDVEGYFRC